MVRKNDEPPQAPQESRYELAMKSGSLPGKHRWRAIAAEVLNSGMLNRLASGTLAVSDESFGQRLEQIVLSRYKVAEVELGNDFMSSTVTYPHAQPLAPMDRIDATIYADATEKGLDWLRDEVLVRLKPGGELRVHVAPARPEGVILPSDTPHRSVGELEGDDELMSVADNEDSGLVGPPYPMPFPDLNGTLLSPVTAIDTKQLSREAKMQLVDQLMTELNEQTDWPQSINAEGMLMLAGLADLPRHVIEVLLSAGYVLKSQPLYPVVFEREGTPDINSEDRIDSVKATFETGITIERTRRIIYEKSSLLSFKDQAYEIISDAEARPVPTSGALAPGAYQIARRPNLDRLRRDMDESEKPTF